MVTCNICGKNKTLDEMQGSFHYVCIECWKKMKITIDDIEIDKDMVY